MPDEKPRRGPPAPQAKYTPKLKSPDDPDYATKSTLVDYEWQPKGATRTPSADPAGAILEERDEDLPVVDVEMEPLDEP